MAAVRISSSNADRTEIVNTPFNLYCAYGQTLIHCTNITDVESHYDDNGCRHTTALFDNTTLYMYIALFNRHSAHAHFIHTSASLKNARFARFISVIMKLITVSYFFYYNVNLYFITVCRCSYVLLRLGDFNCQL